MSINIQVCPSCGHDDIYHLLVSTAGTDDFMKSGWYCQTCHAGPFQLSNFSENEAARFAVELLNKKFTLPVEIK